MSDETTDSPEVKAAHNLATAPGLTLISATALQSEIQAQPLFE